jgi:RNA polymerase sigma-70 factor (ECF subfamily)
MFSVAKKMKDFHYDTARGSFKGCLLQLTGWRITNQFHRRSARGIFVGPELAGGEGSAAAMEPDSQFVVPPELYKLWQQEWELNLMQAALDRVRTRVNPKHFQVFDLAVLQHKPLKQIQEFLDISMAEVYLAKHRVGKLVQSELARLRKQEQ